MSFPVCRRKTGQKYQNMQYPEYDHHNNTLCQVITLPLWQRHLPRFMLFFDNHDVIHPTPERRSPGLTGSMVEEKAPTAPESAAHVLDGVEPG
jgi:hypothetical protein